MYGQWCADKAWGVCLTASRGPQHPGIVYNTIFLLPTALLLHIDHSNYSRVFIHPCQPQPELRVHPLQCDGILVCQGP